MPQNSQSNVAKVTFVVSGNSEVYEVEIDDALTGAAAIQGLVAQAGLPAPSPELSYALKLKRTKAELPLDRPLLQSGVQTGDIIAVVRSDIGAARASWH